MRPAQTSSTGLTTPDAPENRELRVQQRLKHTMADNSTGGSTRDTFPAARTTVAPRAHDEGPTMTATAHQVSYTLDRHRLTAGAFGQPATCRN